LAHVFRREYSHERLKLAQLLGRHGVFLTLVTLIAQVPAPASNEASAWSVVRII
jgi:hypothetical protein